MRKLYSLIAAVVLLGALTATPAEAHHYNCSTAPGIWIYDGWFHEYEGSYHDTAGRHNVYWTRRVEQGGAGFFQEFICNVALT